VEGVDETVQFDLTSGEELPFKYDYQFALMSAPHLLNVTGFDGKPYINGIEDDLRTFVKEQTQGTFNVGIVWQGSSANPDDAARSISLWNISKL
jgi:hypothetical protein